MRPKQVIYWAEFMSKGRPVLPGNTKFWSGNFKGRDQLGTLDVDGILLKWVLDESVVKAWSGSR
jgi:hypothetical protein